jgi:hypothetical protein
MEEHARGLARALRGDDAPEAAERARSFVSSFIRPHGLDRRATPMLVDALRALAARQTAAAGPEIDDLAEVLAPILAGHPGAGGPRKPGKPRRGRARRSAEMAPRAAS